MAIVPTPVISPLNDISLIAPLRDIDPTTGRQVKLTSGAVSFFLSITDDPATATPADPAFTGNASHVGNGNWLIQFDAAVLTVAKMEAAFAATPPFLIVQLPSGFFVNLPLIYSKKKKAVLVAAS